MTDGERLKAARKALGLSVEQFADALGLRGDNARDDVRNWERGRRKPSGVVVRCAELLADRARIVADLEAKSRHYWGDGVNPYDEALSLFDS